MHNTQNSLKSTSHLLTGGHQIRQWSELWRAKRRPVEDCKRGLMLLNAFQSPRRRSPVRTWNGRGCERPTQCCKSIGKAIYCKGRYWESNPQSGSFQHRYEVPHIEREHTSLAHNCDHTTTFMEECLSRAKPQKTSPTTPLSYRSILSLM